MNAPTNFLRLPADIERVGKSRTAIYRDIPNGIFLAPVRIGARSVAWESTAIERWQQERINAATQANQH